MNEEIAIEVSKWLLTCKDMICAEPVVVHIGQEVFYGARYQQTFRHGEKSWIHEAIYLIGQLPKRHERVCYVHNKVEWYLGGHYQVDIVPEDKKHYHPFGGHNFMICPWKHEAKIDQYERSPYIRIDMRIDVVSTGADHAKTNCGQT